LAGVLTGLSTATNAAVTAADSILVALGKLQAQINSHVGLTVYNGAHKIAVLNPITYWISPTGNDTTGDGTGGNPFATIQHALDILPKILLNDVSIMLSAGSYPGNVTIAGFIGDGQLSITGGSSLATAVNYNIGSVSVTGCSAYIALMYFASNAVNADAFSIVRSQFVYMGGCISASAASSNRGIIAVASKVYVSGCQFSNKGYAIWADVCAEIFSYYNSGGTGNGYALYARAGGTIAKSSTQPSATTAETTTEGGVIR
jgi:hypothetical protein